MCYAWNLVGPDLLLLERMVGIALGQEVLKTSHVLQAEEGYLVVRLLGVSAQSQMPIAGRIVGVVSRKNTWCVIWGEAGYSHFRPVLRQ